MPTATEAIRDELDALKEIVRITETLVDERPDEAAQTLTRFFAYLERRASHVEEQLATSRPSEEEMAAFVSTIKARLQV